MVSTQTRHRLWQGWQAEEKIRADRACIHPAFPAMSPCPETQWRRWSKREPEFRLLIWLARFLHVLRTGGCNQVMQGHRRLWLATKHDGRNVLEVPGNRVR